MSEETIMDNAFDQQLQADNLDETGTVSSSGEDAEEFNRLWDELDAKFADYEAKCAELAEWEAGLEAKGSELSSRERDLRSSEQELEQSIKSRSLEADAEIVKRKQEADSEIFKKRQEAEAEISALRSDALSALEKEINESRASRMKEIDSAIESERNRAEEEIARERKTWEEEKSKESTALAVEKAELAELRGVLSAQLDEVNRRTAEYQSKERDLEELEARIRERAKRRSERLDQEAADLAAEYKATADAEKAAMRAENDNLRRSLQTQKGLLSAYDELAARLGGEAPEKVLLSLDSKTEEIRALKEELVTRPTDELRERYETMTRELRAKDAVIEDLRRKVEAAASATAAEADLRRQIKEAEAESKTNANLARIFETSAKQATAELEKLQADFDRLYGTPAGEEERREEIEMPYFIRSEAKQPAIHYDTETGRPLGEKIDEIEWLDGVHKACEEYGLHFNRRLLMAFHTALKTAEWAPITVLAGVSGTGKSELPRLYSHFGGIYFAPISVQPNWDSQESMLGFFNSIDNRFDAQPILNFLAQTQKPWERQDGGYPGLQDAMNLVLLDEMNLAHPELYFAEFLSKLELRRGYKPGDIPKLDVNIGAGKPKYKLPLGRNVLWVGTMNQDETTKSLSDKVLDRSIIMYFPRPTELKRRKKLKPLSEKNRGEILSKYTWDSWVIKQSIFEEDEIGPYKRFVEKMNSYLGVAGRAIGHRVWQSVEYYMSNYPEVLAAGKDKRAKAEAMHIAFEDQLVQKVMPKLRGIDTRGKSRTDCLDKIRDQLIEGVNEEGFDLIEDFDQSCDLGYGQFVWQTANYLKEEEAGRFEDDN